MQLGRYAVESGDGTLTLTRLSGGAFRLIHGAVVLLLLAAIPVGVFVDPVAQIMLVLVLGVATVPMVIIGAQELAGRGALIFVRRSLVIGAGGGDSPYRDAAKTELIVDGKRYDATRVRDVQVRVVAVRGPTIYNVYIFLDGCAIRVDGSRSPLSMDRLAGEIRRALGLGVSPSDHQLEPVLMSGLAVLVLLVLMHVGVITVAAGYSAVAIGPREHLHWGEAAIGPVAVLLADLVFTRWIGLALRGLVRRHTRALIEPTGVG